MIVQLVPLATGLLTLFTMWLAGNKHQAAWIVGLINQALWVATIVLFEAWGLAPLTVAITVIYARNLRRWRREAAAEGSPA